MEEQMAEPRVNAWVVLCDHCFTQFRNCEELSVGVPIGVCELCGVEQEQPHTPRRTDVFNTIDRQFREARSVGRPQPSRIIRPGQQSPRLIVPGGGLH